MKSGEKMIKSNNKLIGLAIKNSEIKNSVFAQLYKKSKTWTLPTILANDSHDTFIHLSALMRSVNIHEVQKVRIVHDSDVLYSDSVLRTIIYETITDKNFAFHSNLDKKIILCRFMPITELRRFRNRTEFMLFYLNSVYTKR